MSSAMPSGASAVTDPARISAPPPESGDSMLTFMLGGEAMAMAAAEVAEVGRVPPYTRIPNAPPGLCGVANLRGRVVPVVSLGALIGQAAPACGPAAMGSAARLLVLSGAAPVGLVVDSVSTLSHAGAGRRLDPRALLDGAFAGLRRVAAAQAPGLAADAAPGPQAPRDEVALVGLRLGGQDYALPLDRVDRVIRVPAALTQVPRTGDAMLGTVAFDGGLLPIVSLGVLLGLPRVAAGSAAARIVVVAALGGRVGLMVESVTATMAVARTAIDAVPAVLMRGAAEAQIEGICRLDGGRRLVCLLSTERLFDAQTAARIGSSRQGEPARMSDPESLPSSTETFVVFRLGAEEYGLPIGAVLEVARMPDSLARVPDAPDVVAGIMSLHGRAVPVIDMAQRFGAARGPGRTGRVIIVSVGGVTAGLAVDGVSDVLSIPLAALQPAPEFEADAAVVDRIALPSTDRMILLISPMGVIEGAEHDLLASLARVAQMAQAKMPAGA